MRKWIELNLKYPIITIILIIILSIISFFGLKKIKFDTSTETMMPQSNIVYRINKRSKKIYGDSKTYVLTAIEPLNGKKLFTKELFVSLNQMVEELEEYKTFNKKDENKRLNTILEAGNIQISKKGKIITENNPASKINKIDEMETELDSELFGDKAKTSQNKKEKIVKNPWDLNVPFGKALYVKAERERNKYNYNNYKPISIGKLRKKLSKDGLRQLKSILIKLELNSLSDSTTLSKREYRSLVEAWESAYLYKSMEIIKTFLNPISGQDILGEKGELKNIEYIPKDDNGKRILPKTEKEFKEFQKILLRNPAYESVLYAIDSNKNFKALAISTVFRPLNDHIDLFNYIYSIIKKYNSHPTKLTPVGIQVYHKYTIDYMRRDLKLLLPLVILVIIITFFLNFRTIRGVALPSAAVIIGTLWIMGIMGYFNIPITLMVNMLPALLISVGSSYSIHVFNQYLHDRKSIYTGDRKKALSLSMSHISSTVMLASLTTAIGFSTLAFSELISLKHLGLLSAIGTFISMVVAVTFIPAMLLLLKRKKLTGDDSRDYKRKNIAVLKIIKFFEYLSENRGKTVIISAIFLLIFGLYGMTKIRLAASPLNNFKKSSYLYKSDFMMGKLFKGSLTINMIIDSGKTNGALDPEFLKYTEKIRTWVTSPENKRKYHMLHTASFGDFIKRIHKAMNNENPDYFTIPDSRETIDDYMKLYSGKDEDSDGRVDAMEPLIDSHFRYANILIRVGSVNGKIYSSRLVKLSKNAIEKYIKKQDESKKYKWFLTGESLNYLVITKMIIQGQLRSIFITLAIVALVILFLFRNIKASIISIIPISMSIIVTYGVMGYFNIPLDISKSLLAAIAIGIGVDDTLHMLKTLRLQLRRGLPMKEAITATYQEAGIAIIYTSLALIFGFSVLLLSQFLPIFYLSILMILTMLTTTISALVILPAIIILFDLKIDKELDWKIFKVINIQKFFEIDD